MSEFSTTALLLTIFGTLLAASAALSRGLERAGIPVALLFLALGMLAGEEGLGGIAFEDYRFSFIVGTIALVLIVFDGGFNTSYASIREGIRPALLLATLGRLAGISGLLNGFVEGPAGERGWRFAFLMQGRLTGLNAASEHPLSNGGLRCRLYVGVC